MPAQLEHLNITVPDARATAAMLEEVFGWHIRWEGEATGGGFSIHVGSDQTYLALYTPLGDLSAPEPRYGRVGAMNHIGVTVEDLDAAEAAFKRLGYEPHHHADYEPGRRFYVFDGDQIEIEVVQY